MSRRIWISSRAISGNRLHGAGNESATGDGRSANEPNLAMLQSS